MDRCSLCPDTNLCIPPDGEGDILFIGEAPGKDEQRKAKVFCGNTGDEVNRHYLPLAGLRRDATCFTNAIRCLPTTAGGKLSADRAGDRALLQSCTSRHLYPHIERGAYRTLVPMGAFACQAICPEVNLEIDHGFPVETAWGIPAFPMYHPALGIHEPKKMLMIRNDWQRLKSYLGCRLHIPEDEYPNPDYREITDVRELEELDPTRVLAGDTESKRTREPYCLTYSQSPGVGRLILSERQDLLLRFQWYLDRWQAPILFHNWLYDWGVTESMGLSFPPRKIVDTMARVFHLGNLPQGLKALSRRELGMRMQDFDDVVTPHSRLNVLVYYQIAASMDWEKPEEQLVMDDKTGKWTLYRPQSMSTKLKRFHTDYSKNPEKDVFKMFEDNWEAHQTEIEEKCGPYPGKCISHVPFDEALTYACRDADSLLRLWPVIQRMNSNVRHTSQEHWRGI